MHFVTDNLSTKCINGCLIHVHQYATFLRELKTGCLHGTCALRSAENSDAVPLVHSSRE